MYRTLCSLPVLAALLSIAVGGSLSPVYANPPVVVEDEKAQIGIEIDFAELLKDKTTAAMLEANPEVPPFVKSMKSMSLYAFLPDSMAKLQDPSNVNFFFELSFSKMGDCDAAFDEMFGNAPTEDVEKNGKTYKVIDQPGAPVVYILKSGGSIKAYSEKYVESGTEKFASKGLEKALGQAPKGEPFKMGFDIQGAKDLLGELAAFAPQAEAFSAAESMTMAGGGQGDLMFMMAVATPDESTAKKIKSTVQTMLAFVAATIPTQMPSEEDAPATNEMLNHVMSKLRPKVDGTTVKVVVNKPDNFEELRKKVTEEAEKLQGKLQGDF